MVGIAVGELAARGRNHRREATDSRETIALLHSVTELVAVGREPREVISAALAELQRLLSLRDGYFTRRDPGNLGARITPQGQLTVAGQSWVTQDLGLPTSRVDLPVRAQGWLLGHFVLTPTRGRPVSGQHLMAAVAVADLVGAVLLADDSGLAASIGRTPDNASDVDGDGAATAAGSPGGWAMTDVLYFIAIIAFVAVMLGFMFLYGQSPDRPEFDAPGRAADVRRSRCAPVRRG